MNLLLEAGADRQVRDDEGKTALNHAAHPDIMQPLTTPKEH